MMNFYLPYPICSPTTTIFHPKSTIFLFLMLILVNFQIGMGWKWRIKHEICRELMLECFPQC